MNNEEIRKCDTCLDPDSPNHPTCVCYKEHGTCTKLHGYQNSKEIISELKKAGLTINEEDLLHLEKEGIRPAFRITNKNLSRVFQIADELYFKYLRKRSINQYEVLRELGLLDKDELLQFENLNYLAKTEEIKATFRLFFFRPTGLFAIRRKLTFQYLCDPNSWDFNKVTSESIAFYSPNQVSTIAKSILSTPVSGNTDYLRNIVMKKITSLRKKSKITYKIPRNKDIFNKVNKLRKKGIPLTPNKSGKECVFEMVAKETGISHSSVKRIYYKERKKAV